MISDEDRGYLQDMEYPEENEEEEIQNQEEEDQNSNQVVKEEVQTREEDPVQGLKEVSRCFLGKSGQFDSF